MVDITCVRCGASETGFATAYTANFGLVHERGCGTKIGVSKYSNMGEVKTTAERHSNIQAEAILKDVEKPLTLKPTKKFSFKKKSKKKKRSD